MKRKERFFIVKTFAPYNLRRRSERYSKSSFTAILLTKFFALEIVKSIELNQWTTLAETKATCFVFKSV
jgi:hypothetical protein